MFCTRGMIKWTLVFVQETAISCFTCNFKRKRLWVLKRTFGVRETRKIEYHLSIYSFSYVVFIVDFLLPSWKKYVFQFIPVIFFCALLRKFRILDYSYYVWRVLSFVQFLPKMPMGAKISPDITSNASVRQNESARNIALWCVHENYY